jgi:hypothetical protein
LGNIDNAIKEMDTLLHYQTEQGWIGHMVYWNPRHSLFDKIFLNNYPDKKMSPLTQPAFIAHALLEIYRTQNAIDPQKATIILNKFYDPIKKYYNLIIQQRVLYKDRFLISNIHPWESGMDSLPNYDQVLGVSGHLMFLKWMWKLVKCLKVNKKCGWNTEKIRDRNYFVVEDLINNVVFAEGLYILSELASVLKIEKDAEELRKQASEMESAILNFIVRMDWNINKRG